MRLKNKFAIVVGAGQTPGDTIGNGRAKRPRLKYFPALFPTIAKDSRDCIGKAAPEDGCPVRRGADLKPAFGTGPKHH